MHFVKPPIALLFLLASVTLFTSQGFAEGRPWKNHAAPYDFLFGNHIDSHQQTKVGQNNTLFGFIYVRYTGEAHNGTPVAVHCDDNTPPQDCVVGWRVRGVPAHATFLYHNNDHPVWLVHGRHTLPQPGGYSHFHWVTPFGSDPRFTNQTGTAGLNCVANTAGELVPNSTCLGYFLEFNAQREFVFKHHDDMVHLVPGLDTATHVNIVTSTSQGSGGDHDH